MRVLLVASVLVLACVASVLASSCYEEFCSTATGDCFASRPSPGCDRPTCCSIVCEASPFCCGGDQRFPEHGFWDRICVETALSVPECVPPTATPTGSPTPAPTGSPTPAPTGTPTQAPTGTPTTAAPTTAPTAAPTDTPTPSPTQSPTTGAPTTAAPTAAPTQAPTQSPTTATPTPTGNVCESAPIVQTRCFGAGFDMCTVDEVATGIYNFDATTATADAHTPGCGSGHGASMWVQVVLTDSQAAGDLSVSACTDNAGGSSTTIQGWSNVCPALGTGTPDTNHCFSLPITSVCDRDAVPVVPESAASLSLGTYGACGAPRSKWLVQLTFNDGAPTTGQLRFQTVVTQSIHSGDQECAGK